MALSYDQSEVQRLNPAFTMTAPGVFSPKGAGVPSGMESYWTKGGQLAYRPIASTSGNAGTTGAANGYTASSGYTGDLASQFQQAMDRANAANQSRYEAIRGGASDTQAAMGGYLGRYDRGMQALQGREQEIELASKAERAARYQDLVNRGLSNSTATATAMGVADRNRSLAYNDLARSKAVLDAQLSGDQLAFMERRTDAGPDLGLLSQLAYQYGQSGAGGGYNMAPSYVDPSAFGYRIPAASWGIPMTSPMGGYYGYSGRYGTGTSAPRYDATRATPVSLLGASAPPGYSYTTTPVVSGSAPTTRAMIGYSTPLAPELFDTALFSGLASTPFSGGAMSLFDPYGWGSGKTANPRISYKF